MHGQIYPSKSKSYLTLIFILNILTFPLYSVNKDNIDKSANRDRKVPGSTSYPLLGPLLQPVEPRASYL